MSYIENPFYPEIIWFWAYAVTIITVLFGVAMHIRLFWAYRIAYAGLLSCLVGISIGLMFVSGLHWSVIIIVVSLQTYRLFSLFRIIKNRVHEKSLKNRSLRSEMIFSTLLLGVLLSEQILYMSNFSTLMGVSIIIYVQFIIVFIFFLHVLKMSKETVLSIPDKFTSDNSLPSITVAIPARNETEELNESLNSILKSNYPKLEVLVVDDCSQDNTSEIIRNFAHAGVRFVSGKTPASSWLAKNYAYHQLLDEAGGKYILFCGTDVRFEPDSIRLIVQAVLDGNLAMLSILPHRKDKANKQFLLQPMRYWRELVVPRVFDKTPPVLSTCWIARRTFLNDNGGFAAHKKTIRPERIFSRIAHHSSSYKFVRSTREIGISSVKNLRDQWNTAIRTRYPELKNRPENIFLYSFIYISVMLGAPVLIIYAILISDLILIMLSVSTVFLLFVVHGIVNKLVSGRLRFIRIITLPLSIVLELIASNYSMWAYEFSEVIWKGRNVCLPVLNTIPTLHKIEDNLNIAEIRNKNRKS